MFVNLLVVNLHIIMIIVITTRPNAKKDVAVHSRFSNVREVS